ncbi:tRNA (adenosine(37)-N6)-threonylcarbamoyltransferase complex dimerization subunit type 1 TsaB [Corynebacterium uropygiale]|uniref:tRNA (Adenosine(37)-N6)-threonylcarbamoyltransferase complex dimerization subunit type 1 TsaB n=1 Tax=Corynebacterium uropygiale TaxID=1775911 RepID=A0A9X1QQH6_9CORY|nr:tRNA (adenosine(37)-N6)-threonylcarbamoyltransferase complex dimerization subunit type 1 TsaB [Corynebacterium uropygiale]
MLTLAIDTATSDLVVGLVDASPRPAPEAPRAELREEVIIRGTRHHNEQLVPAVLDTLRRAGAEMGDLEAVVVGCGPGPFTGLRVGMATGQAFADALGIPVYGVCSLDAIWRGMREALPEATDFLVATDARRREVYWARYTATERVAGPDVIAPAELEIPPIVEAINVPVRLSESLASDHPAPRFDLAPTPVALVESAALGEPPEPLRALYLRRPDAQVPRSRPLSPAIPRSDS